jgi:hypothetical protein
LPPCRSARGAPQTARGPDRALDFSQQLDRDQPELRSRILPASLSCRSCRPNAPFAELVRLSKTSIADEMWIEHTRRVLGE